MSKQSRRVLGLIAAGCALLVLGLWLLQFTLPARGAGWRPGLRKLLKAAPQQRQSAAAQAGPWPFAGNLDGCCPSAIV
jgi:hypothetical protein